MGIDYTVSLFGDAKVRIRSVVFDFDGTLFDTKIGILECLRSAADRFGVDSSILSDWVIGPPAEESAERLMPDRSEATRHEFLVAYREEYSRRGWLQSLPYPGVLSLLDWLRARQIQMFICTSKRMDLTLKLLRHYRIEESFLAIAADDPSLKSHHKKDLLKNLIVEQNIDVSRCVMIGDSIYDVEGARATGMTVIAVLYGYGKREELIGSRPDATCESPCELTGILATL